MSRHAYWLATLLFLALVLLKFSPQTGFTSLIRFGESRHAERLTVLQKLPIAMVPDSNGYDGQFYAQIALDPLLQGSELQKVLDAPAYRARRILAPATASMLGLGNPWWTLQAFALLNVACWCALGWQLRRIIAGDGWIAFARWAGCMFSLGALDSVRQSLVDLPALLLLVMAVDSHGRSRNHQSSLWLALGNLTKETNLLGALALHCGSPMQWRRTLVSLSLVVTPLVVWAIYVQQRFSGSSGGAGLGNFDWPLFGLLIQIKYSLHELFSGNFDGRYSFSLLAVLGLFTQVCVLWRNPQPQSAWWRIGIAYSVLWFFFSHWIWSGYWAACRAVLPMTLAFNLLLPAKDRFWPLWILGNLTLLHGVWRFL